MARRATAGQGCPGPPWQRPGPGARCGRRPRSHRRSRRSAGAIGHEVKVGDAQLTQVVDGGPPMPRRVPAKRFGGGVADAARWAPGSRVQPGPGGAVVLRSVKIYGAEGLRGAGRVIRRGQHQAPREAMPSVRRPVSRSSTEDDVVEDGGRTRKSDLWSPEPAAALRPLISFISVCSRSWRRSAGRRCRFVAGQSDSHRQLVCRPAPSGLRRLHPEPSAGR